MARFPGTVSFTSVPTMGGGSGVVLERYVATVGFGDIDAAGTKEIIPAVTGKSWRIREVNINGAGTNFSGGSGDRNLRIQDSSGTVVVTTIPTASIATLVSARLGSSAVPIPDSAYPAVTTAGEAVVALYQGGTADYTAGSVTIEILAERV